MMMMSGKGLGNDDGLKGHLRNHHPCCVRANRRKIAKAKGRSRTKKTAPAHILGHGVAQTTTEYILGITLRFDICCTSWTHNRRVAYCVWQLTDGHGERVMGHVSHCRKSHKKAQ